MSEEIEPAGAPTPVEVRRPGGVTFVIGLVWISAIGDLIAGIALLLVSFNSARFADVAITPSLVRYYGLIAIVLGLLTLMVALGLASGSQFARVFSIMVMVLRLLNGAWALIAIRNVTLWPAVFDVVMATLVITLLSNRSASDYFRKRT